MATTLEATVPMAYKIILRINVLQPDEYIALAKGLDKCAMDVQAFIHNHPAGSQLRQSPAFQTAFRQYRDQIKVAQGLVANDSAPIEDWVRCKRLLFEALDNLMSAVPADLDHTLDSSTVSDQSGPAADEETSADEPTSSTTVGAVTVRITGRKAPNFNGHSTNCKWRGYRVYAGPRRGYYVIQNMTRKYLRNDMKHLTSD